MNHSITFAILCAAAFCAPSSAIAAKRLCIDTQNDRVVTRKRCKEPRFFEVTPALLVGNSAGVARRVNISQTLSLSVEGDFSGSSLPCPEGTIATGGGASISDNDGLNIRRSIPSSGLEGWTASVEAVKNGATGIMNIYAVCVSDLVFQEEEEEEEED